MCRSVEGGGARERIATSVLNEKLLHRAWAPELASQENNPAP